VTWLAYQLHRRQPAFPSPLLTVKQVVEELCRLTEPVKEVA